MTDQDHLDRIDALTRNARNTWFALLAALVFVTITLMSVEHIDFYGVNRATQLPLVNISVPTPYFFAAAPVLIAAIYGYFHLYLIRLWDALGAAPPERDGVCLGDSVTPWLVIDAALHWCGHKQQGPAAKQRPLDRSVTILNLMLAWGSGIAVLAALWCFSMPARSFLITGLAGLSLAISIVAGMASWNTMIARLRQADQTQRTNVVSDNRTIRKLLFWIVVIVVPSLLRTEGPIILLADVNLIGENIVERPSGWLPYNEAKTEFLAHWRARGGLERNCGSFSDQEPACHDEFEIRQKAVLAEKGRPGWHKIGRQKPDFRGSLLSDSFMAGVNLTEARMQQANLRKTQMPWANLRKTQLGKAVFRIAQMQGVNLKWAQMQGTILADAQMQQVVFDFSVLTGSVTETNNLEKANLSMSTNRGGMLRFVDLENIIFDNKTDFRNAFLDGSVLMKEKFRARMGSPCQWVDKVIMSDTEFYGRWRGWIESNSEARGGETWKTVGPRKYQDVVPIQPPPGCVWKTGPMQDTTSK